MVGSHREEGVGGRQPGRGCWSSTQRTWVITQLPHNRSHDPSAYRILLGYHRLRTPTSHSRQASVYRVIVNTDFNKHYYMGSDITLLQLYRPVDFSDYIRPVCLPGPNTQLPPHTSCWITGWGMVTEDRLLSSPYTLQEGEVGIMDSQVCASYFQGPDPNNNTYSLHDDMLCAGDLMTGKSICRGAGLSHPVSL
uniref:Peptidase S1 domain-containing protein n=1 Tax=Phocoena sinus TaxID=42100 RepID=A0A8C9AV19_PHOSS